MGVGAAIVGGAAISAFASSRSAGKAADVQADASAAGIAEQRAARESFEERTEPFRQIGLQAGEDIQSLLADPTQGLEEINPIVSFLRDQGFEQIQESAAANRRLGAGGTLNDLTRFNLDLSATVAPQLQNQRFNQLFNLLGAGQNAATGQGQAALSTGANISNLLGAGGAAQASGIVGQSNALSGFINQGAGVAGAFPNLFGGGGGGGSGAGGGGGFSTPANQFLGANQPFNAAFGNITETF